MKLKDLLNKFANSDFLLTVNGWCDELHFSEYEVEKNESYWIKFKDKNVIDITLLVTNELPELVVRIEEG